MELHTMNHTYVISVVVVFFLYKKCILGLYLETVFSQRDQNIPEKFLNFRQLA